MFIHLNFFFNMARDAAAPSTLQLLSQARSAKPHIPPHDVTRTHLYPSSGHLCTSLYEVMMLRNKHSKTHTNVLNAKTSNTSMAPPVQDILLNLDPCHTFPITVSSYPGTVSHRGALTKPTSYCKKQIDTLHLCTLHHIIHPHIRGRR